MKFPTPKPLNLGQQLASIRRDFHGGTGGLRGNTLEWTGILTPMP